MQDRHVAFDGPVIRFRFRGKHGIGHEIEVKDPKLSKIVRACQRVPGDELFQYIDADGKIHDVTSHEVNAYLREITGGDYTAKDFRTWAGTVLASMALQEFSTFDSTAQAKRNILNAIRRVADQLGNTPTVCRQCYVHPAVVEAYLDGSLRAVLKDRTQQQMERSLGKLKPAEATVLALLRNRLGQRRAAQRRGA
jgi:DNA topoisomerase-1